MSSGGSWRSASIITTASPAACSRPAVSAVWWPKFRDSVTTRMRLSAAASSARIVAVASLEPSSTTTISNGIPWSAATVRSQNSADVVLLVEHGRHHAQQRQFPRRRGSTGRQASLAPHERALRSLRRRAARRALQRRRAAGAGGPHPDDRPIRNRAVGHRQVPGLQPHAAARDPDRGRAGAGLRRGRLRRLRRGGGRTACDGARPARAAGAPRRQRAALGSRLLGRLPARRGALARLEPVIGVEPSEFASDIRARAARARCARPRG